MAKAATNCPHERRPVTVLLLGLLQRREDKIPPQGKSRPKEALQRLVQLYEGWDIAAPTSAKLEKAAPFRNALEALNQAQAEKKPDANR
jgi:hypothetical protein